MLILMKQYGRIIVYCIAAILVFSVLFCVPVEGNTGFVQMIFGKAMNETGHVDVRAYGDTDAVLTAAARSKPEIIYTYAKILPGAETNLESMFSAVDAKGNPVEVKITDVVDAYGVSILYETKEDRKNKIGSFDTAEFRFPSAGIYTVHIKAVDVEKKVTCGQYKVPVTGI